jgi:Fur family transcriptional regulator, ferric uptake regulator
MDKKTVEEIALEKLLRADGFRITSGRMKLFQLLAKAQKPLSIQAISKRWRGMPPNPTTLYRTLTDLAKVGIVRRVDLNTGTAHFEYTPDSPHHHHVVCTDCGVMEDVESCSVEKLQTQVMKNSRRFKSIYSHSLEFFGRCESCIKV